MLREAAAMAHTDDEAVGQPRFYGDLAAWWPLISPVDDYAEEARWVGTLLGAAASPVRNVLELGSGGGHQLVSQFLLIQLGLIGL